MAGERKTVNACSVVEQQRFFELIFARCASFSLLRAESSCRRQNFGYADQIVGSGCEHEEPFDQGATAMPGLAQAADGLDPAEWFFDPLALDGTDAIAGMAGGASIDRRTAVGIVLRDMRCA